MKADMDSSPQEEPRYSVSTSEALAFADELAGVQDCHCDRCIIALAAEVRRLRCALELLCRPVLVPTLGGYRVEVPHPQPTIVQPSIRPDQVTSSS